MDTNKATPGPWVRLSVPFGEHDTRWEIETPAGEHIATMPAQNRRHHANSQLVIMAPDFAAACTTPDGTSRLSQLVYILDRYEALNGRLGERETKTDKEALAASWEMVHGLRAAVAKSGGRP